MPPHESEEMDFVDGNPAIDDITQFFEDRPAPLDVQLRTFIRGVSNVVERLLVARASAVEHENQNLAEAAEEEEDQVTEEMFEDTTDEEEDHEMERMFADSTEGQPVQLTDSMIEEEQENLATYYDIYHSFINRTTFSNFSTFSNNLSDTYDF